MNIKQILAQAVILEMIGIDKILDSEKRPSVDDINDTLADDDNHSYKLTAADCDAAFKAVKADAQAQAKVLAILQQRNDELDQAKEDLAEQIARSGSLSGELEIAKTELVAATNGAKSQTSGSAEAGETMVVLLTSVYDGELIPCTGEAVAINDAVLAELTEGVNYKVF